MRFVLQVAYDGTCYSGWQRQKNAISVQQVLEETISNILHVPIKITASGRTDAGVHALGQVCHFDSEEITVPPEKMPDCINRFLPKDISIIKGWMGKEGFDSNRSAKKKTYCYNLYCSEHPIPLLDRFAVRVVDVPSEENMRKFATYFEGEHDYKAFCASGSSVKTTVRTVYFVNIEKTLEYNCPFFKIYVCGNGFLYNMVRTMVGELLDLSKGKKSVESLKKAFLDGDRTLLGKTMPAKGLVLMNVDYGENL